MALPLSYNIRNALQRPVSTLTTAAGIALTVTIFVAALALAAGFQVALQETGSRDSAIVMRKGASSEISSYVARDVASIIRAHPSVATDADGRALASPEMVVVTNKPRLGQTGSSNVMVRGVDPEVLLLRKEIQIVDGRMFEFGTDEVIVGQRIAPRFAGCGIGEKVTFGQRQFTVVGHFSSGGTAFESEIWGDNEVLQPALNRNGYQTMTFRMRDPAALAELKKEFEADPRLQVEVQRESTFFSNQSELLSSLIRFLGVFITVIMAVGAIFGAMNTMYAAVQSRTREIAVLMVLGFGPFAVMTSFVIESVVVALIGGVLGCLLALPINGIVTSTTNFSSFSEVAFAFRITPVALAAGLTFSLLMGLVGGLLPAFRAARQTPATSLRAL